MESTGKSAKSMEIPAIPPAIPDTNHNLIIFKLLKASLRLKWCAQTKGLSAALFCDDVDMFLLSKAIINL